MIRTCMKSTAIAALICVFSAWGQTAFATEPFSCGLQVLKSASGVIGMKHSYTMSGSCSESWVSGESTSSFGGVISGSTKNSGYTIQLVGEATWDRATGATEEILKISGDVTGERVTKGKCSQDPFLKDPPDGYGSPCTEMDASMQITSGELWKAMANSKEFWFAKMVPLATAQALSKENKPKEPTPPPPPPKPDIPKVSMGEQGSLEDMAKTSLPPEILNPGATLNNQIPGGSNIPTGIIPGAVSTQSAPAAASDATVPNQPQVVTRGPAPGQELPRASGDLAAANVSMRPRMLNFEAEDLFSANKIKVEGGNAGPQSMSGFGSGWSNNSQLFWGQGSPGAVLDLILDVPAAATYAVELYMTRAPDYGILKIEVDGKASPVEFYGYSPRVIGANPVQVGKFSLQAGQRNISFMIIDKNENSTGYAAGIDRVKLYPVGAP